MRASLLVSLACLLPGAAFAQAHDHHAQHAPAPAPAADPHAHHHQQHSPPAAKPADPHAGHAPAAAPSVDASEGRTGAKLPVGSAPAPAPVRDHAADRVWKSGMQRAREILAQEHGGMRLASRRLERLEYSPGHRSDGYAWEGEARIGGDVDSLILETEGEGDLSGELEQAEVQALWSHALGPYFDLRAGLRQDLQPRGRTYAALGIEGLAPYWLEVEGTLFISHRGVASARLEGSWDLRVTQRLILEPRAELNLGAGDDKALGLGSGLRDAEVGLRLRYEIRREFAPYVGVQYERSFGRTARLGRDEGEDVEQTRAIVGLRTAF